MNVLSIGAHFDDIELGCGGTLARHCAAGDNVHAFIATKSGFSNTTGETIRSNKVAEQEGIKALNLLGINNIHTGSFNTLKVEFTDELNIQIVRLVEKYKIDIVYTHWDGDIHHDHQAVSRASLHSCRHVTNLFMYRSNWYHSTNLFTSNYYKDITEFWPIKEKALQAHTSEMQRTYNKWIEFFKNEAINQGQKIGVRYAEVFQVVKCLT